MDWWSIIFWGVIPILTVIAVFIAGIVVDFVRDCCFKFVARIWKQIFAGKAAK